MPRVNVPLTRSTLLATQRSLRFARQGYELLDRKRTVLLAELMATLGSAEEAQSALQTGLDAAYGDLARARMAMGVDRVRWAALAVRERPQISVVERSLMGAVVPTIDCARAEVRPSYSLMDTAPPLDAARRSFAQLVERLCRAAEAQATVLRLAREINKTQRRVNALRNLIIPRQEAIVKAVQEALEEAERETFLRAKRFKKADSQMSVGG